MPLFRKKQAATVDPAEVVTGDHDPQNPFLTPEDAPTAAPVQQEPMESSARVEPTQPAAPAAQHQHQQESVAAAPEQHEAASTSHLQQQHSVSAADTQQLDASGAAPAGQAAPSFTEQAKHAADASMSATQVATLAVWIVLITGWTGFQVVQNAQWIAQLAGYNFGFKTPPPGSNPAVTNLGDPTLTRERQGLWLLVAVEAGLTLVLPGLAVPLLLVPACHSCKRGERPRRVRWGQLVWLLTLVLVGCAWFKLLLISSAWNKFAYQGLFCTAGPNLDLGQTFEAAKGAQPACQVAGVITPMRMGLVFALLTIAFHMLMYFVHEPKGACGKLLGLLPGILLVALLLIKPVTSIMNVHYTQQWYTSQGNFTFASEMILAIIELVTAVWLSLYMGWAAHGLRLMPRWANTLLACCGREYRDVYYEQEDPFAAKEPKQDALKEAEEGQARRHEKFGRRSYSLRAAGKSIIQQFFMMGQMPVIFGFLSPMVTYFSLGVHNWWIVFDIVVGAVMVFLYMVMCGLHRRLFEPVKAYKPLAPRP